MRFFRRKKKGLLVNNDITAIDGIVLARNGDILTNECIENIASIPLPVRRENVRLGDTQVFEDFKFVINQEKYLFITNNGSKRDSLLRLLADIRLNPLLIKEFEWIKRLEYHKLHSLVVSLMVTRMMMDFYEDEKLAREAAAYAITFDVGISRVPEHILNKVGSLDEDEKSVLHEHPIYCYLLLSYYFGDTQHPGAQVAFEHHEDLLGTGYPRKIVPQDLLTNCIHMCDLYDSLISARPFRPALSPHQAYDILAEKVDRKQMDPMAFTLLNAYLHFLD